MHHATNPSASHMPRHLESPQSVLVTELRPLLAKCRALMGVAAKEPPFLSRHRVLLSTWGPVLGSLDTLVTRVAALESLLEGDLASLTCVKMTGAVHIQDFYFHWSQSYMSCSLQDPILRSV